MALTPCPECQQQISDTAYRCNHCGFRIRQAKRGAFGQIFKWGFIGFNLLMVFFLYAAWGSTSEVMQQEHMTDGGMAGAALGGTMMTGMILIIWALGDIILGALVFFTRAKER